MTMNDHNYEGADEFKIHDLYANFLLDLCRFLVFLVLIILRVPVFLLLPVFLRLPVLLRLPVVLCLHKPTSLVSAD